MRSTSPASVFSSCLNFSTDSAQRTFSEARPPTNLEGEEGRRYSEIFDQADVPLSTWMSFSLSDLFTNELYNSSCVYLLASEMVLAVASACC